MANMLSAKSKQPPFHMMLTKDDQVSCDMYGVHAAVSAEFGRSGDRDHQVEDLRGLSLGVFG